MARAADDSANLGAATSATIRVGGSRSCPCSLFGDLAPTQSTNDNQAIEVGVRFRADVDGFITGLRYYGAASSTPRVGHLWTEAGTQLASATFVGDSLVGWHTVALSPAVRYQGHQLRRLLPLERRHLLRRPRVLQRGVRRGPAARAGRHQRRLHVRRRLPHRELRRHQLRRRRPLHADRPDAAAGRVGRSRRRVDGRRPRRPGQRRLRRGRRSRDRRCRLLVPAQRGGSARPGRRDLRRGGPHRHAGAPARRWPGAPRTRPRSRGAPSASPTSPATRSPRTARGRSPRRRRRPASTAPARSAPRARSRAPTRVSTGRRRAPPSACPSRRAPCGRPRTGRSSSASRVPRARAAAASS